jgi:ABC-type glycerol-3-phosphate transport system substrate-binding protein
MGPETATAIRAALEQGWYSRAEMPELTTVGNALSQALAGETTLAESLPGTVEIQPAPLPPTPDSEPVVVATPRVTPTPGSDVIVIEYSPTSHDDREAIILLAETFNERQDRIRVNAAKHPPFFRPNISFNIFDFAAEYDCFMGSSRAASLAEEYGDAFFDAFYSLTPLFEAEDAVFQNDFTLMSQYMEINTVNGQLYALPVVVRPVVIRYNADLLAARDVAPPAADWTVEDFWALAQAASSDSTYGLVAVTAISPEELLSFVPGADFYFDTNTSPMRPKFTDPAVIGALEFLGRMAEEGVIYPNTLWASRHTREENSQIQSQAHSVIHLGKAAIWGHEVGTMIGGGSLVASGNPVPYPQRTLPNYISREGSGTPSMLYISRRSPDPTACWEWFKFLTEQPEDIFLGLPIRQSVRESQAWRDAVGEETAVAYETMYFRPQPEEPLPSGWEFWPYRRWWADALLSVYQGEDPALILANAQRRAETFYDCYAPLAELNYPDLPPFAQVLECAQQADPDFRW